MNNSVLGSLLGAGVGGGLGQMVDAPRRWTWNMLGLPDTGAELLGNLGMDQESPWTQALGVGAEMVGDPLTWIGGGVGGGLGRLLGRGAKIADSAKDISTVIQGPARVASASERLRNLVPGLRQHMRQNYDNFVADKWKQMAAARDASQSQMPWGIMSALGGGAALGGLGAYGQNKLGSLLAMEPEPLPQRQPWQPQPRPEPDEAERILQEMLRDIEATAGAR